jgi:hypothetical protein
MTLLRVQKQAHEPFRVLFEHTGVLCVDALVLADEAVEALLLLLPSDCGPGSP